MEGGLPFKVCVEVSPAITADHELRPEMTVAEAIAHIYMYPLLFPLAKSKFDAIPDHHSSSQGDTPQEIRGPREPGLVQTAFRPFRRRSTGAGGTFGRDRESGGLRDQLAG